MSRNAHLVLQLCLLVVWLLIIFGDMSERASSQACTQPDFMWQNPLRKFWRPNFGNVVVKIDSRFATQYSEAPDAVTRISAGHQLWNPQNSGICAGVTFTDFGTRSFTQADYDAEAPVGNVYWQVTDPGNGFNGGVASHYGSDDRVISANIQVAPNLILPDHNPIYFNYLGSHEVGHTFNLANCTTACTPSSIMGGHTNGVADAAGPGECDIQKVNLEYCPAPSPSPTPSSSPTPPETESECQSWGWEWNSFTSSCSPGGVFINPCPDNCTPEMFGEPGQGGNSCVGPTDFCVYPSGGCESGYANSGNGCCCSSFNSPILIDVSGNGFTLTNAAEGVDFDINGDGIKERLAWTAANSDDAWLVLDHSNNGAIDNGRELFGNYTPQTRPAVGTAANGFLALAEYDKTPNGGNGDGIIDQSDAVFSRLRLWRDENHNGLAEGTELHRLQDLQVSTLELDYKESKQTDVYGNKFRYRAKVRNLHGQQTGRWAWDVFLVKSVN